MTTRTPLPSPTDPTAHLRRIYALYLAQQAGDVVMYVFPGARSVRLYAMGQGRPAGVALAAAEDEQPVKMLMWGLIKGERVPPG